jgi:hypothetical protein
LEDALDKMIEENVKLSNEEERLSYKVAYL